MDMHGILTLESSTEQFNNSVNRKDPVESRYGTSI